MKVLPIHYVAEMDEARRFYAALGLVGSADASNGHWHELTGTGGTIALHATEPGDEFRPGSVSLSFLAEEPLEAVAERLAEAGFPTEGITDESWGRSFRVADPDGTYVLVYEAADGS
jgi:catechol 2,3-dioxygenase-like lactoylglutathione lyase family enzyme